MNTNDQVIDEGIIERNSEGQTGGRATALHRSEQEGVSQDR